jgi:predicted  nucleic acid-binding Zn-ribbon protein
VITTRAKIYRWYEKLDIINRKINNNENLEMIKKEIETLKDEIQTKTQVPLSYKGEYYNLIVHIELLETKINKIEQSL